MCGREGTAILSSIVRKSFIEKVRYEQRPEGGEGEGKVCGRGVLPLGQREGL